MSIFLSSFSLCFVPIVFITIILTGWIKGVDVYNVFIDGARDGMKTAVRIAPYMISMLFAINVFRTSGAFDLLIKLVTPCLDLFGVPGEIIPLMILRPLSGTGSLGYVAELLKTHGPDSFIGRLASSIQGSTDTTFYILTVYFGSVGIKHFRHAIWVGLAADLTGFISAIVICNLIFR